jgi:hypothetical protein
MCVSMFFALLQEKTCRCVLSDFKLHAWDAQIWLVITYCMYFIRQHSCLVKNLDFCI